MKHHEAPLLSATSFLVSPLSGLFCSELPPTLSYLFCSFCNPILLFAQPAQCVLQPPAAIPHSTRVALWLKPTFREAVTMCSTTSSCNPACQERRSITECFPARACAKAFCHRRLQTRNVAPNRPTFALRTCQFFLGTLCKIQLSLQFPAHFANLLRACSSLTFSSANRAIQSGDVWCTFAGLIFQKCSEHAIFLKFEMQIESKRALATVLCTFCRQLSQIAGRTRRNRHPTSAMKEATLPEKNTRFCAQDIFNP